MAAAASGSSLRKLGIDAVSLTGRRVLCRVDFNTPMKEVSFPGKPDPGLPTSTAAGSTLIQRRRTDEFHASPCPAKLGVMPADGTSRRNSQLFRCPGISGSPRRE